MGRPPSQSRPRQSLDNGTILALLPAYLYDIEDFVSLTSVNRSIRSHLFDAITPHQHLRLAYASRRIFFRPSPLYLLTHLIRGLSTWSSHSPVNLRRFVEAIWLGSEAVLELAVDVPEVALLAGWNRHKPREMYEWRMRVVNPLADLLDKCVGEQWQAQEDFWNRDDAYTLDADPPGLLFRLMMYGEAFGGASLGMVGGHGADAMSGSGTGLCLEGNEGNTQVHLPPHLSLATRLEFIKYLFPDWRLPRHPSTLRPITSDRNIRPDEYVYIRPSIDSDSPQAATPADPRTLPRMKAFTHPLRDVCTEIGPYANHWTRDPLQPASNHDDPIGWVMSQRAAAEDNVAGIEHLLWRSQHWRKFIQSFLSDLKSGRFPGKSACVRGTEDGDHVDKGTHIAPCASSNDNGLDGLNEHEEHDEHNEDAPHWDHKWPHVSGAPWLLGLEGAELLAAYYRDHYSSQGRAVEDSPDAPSLVARSVLSDSSAVPGRPSEEDIRHIADKLAQLIMTMARTPPESLGPVKIGNSTCFEMPCLAAEARMLTRQ